MTFYDEGTLGVFKRTYKTVIVEKEDVDRLFRTGGGAGSVTPSPPPIGQVDEVRGASTDDALISAAAAMSDNLGAPRIRTMSSLIPDVARRQAFLTKLARAEPFTQDDVDYIFKADPDTGVPEYVDVWQLFDQYVGANLIVMRTETEIGA